MVQEDKSVTDLVRKPHGITADDLDAIVRQEAAELYDGHTIEAFCASINDLIKRIEQLAWLRVEGTVSVRPEKRAKARLRRMRGFAEKMLEEISAPDGSGRMARAQSDLGLALEIPPPPEAVTVSMEWAIRSIQRALNTALTDRWLTVDTMLRTYTPQFITTPEELDRGREAILHVARLNPQARLTCLVGLPIKLHVDGGLTTREIDGGPGPALRMGIALSQRLWGITVGADELRGRWERQWV